MIFSSAVFLFAYLPLTLALYAITPARWRNATLLLLSLLFYAWGEPIYLWVMVLSMTVSYGTGLLIGRYRLRRPQAARFWLVATIVFQVGLLVFFKYSGWMLQTLRAIPALAPLIPIPAPRALPIGISFYTFQILSYSIDVYRGDVAAQKKWVPYSTYVSLFPQLIAGPIVRYRDVHRDLAHRTQTLDCFASGVRRFILGFAKKILLGDSLAALSQLLRASDSLEPTILGAWVSMIAMGLHIYFDFSGYSDMAIGLGRMFGFSFPENFRTPYEASSLSDFWRRWHMTLTDWFRSYVYIPLGGNRVSLFKRLRNLWVVWALTGLWHGASWNFVLWGMYYLIGLALEKHWIKKQHPLLGRIYTLPVVFVGWILFFSPDLTEAFAWMGRLVGVRTVGLSTPTLGYDCLCALPLLLLSCLCATSLPGRWIKRWTRSFRQTPRRAAVSAALEAASILLLLGVNLAYMISGSYSPFLYFQF